MRVLADRHHADLFESYYLTFADRFGWEVYAPIGMGWFDRGYWAFEKSFHGDAVAKQYLVGVYPDVYREADYWTSEDDTHPGRVIKAVEIDQAQAQQWDYIICSLPEWAEHFDGFRRLANETGAKLIAQVGNIGAINRIDWSRVDAGLVSTTLHGVRIPVPHVVYRQEFSLADFRYEWPPRESKSVASFIQCFAENRGPDRGSFYDTFERLARDNPDFDWQVYGSYGSQPEDEYACGNLSSTPLVAEKMRDCRIAWHAKYWSDGYGHVVHNLHAVGRPIFAYHDYYANELAGPLMQHGVTGFDLGSMSAADIVDTLRRLRDDDEYHRQICEQTVGRFREVVNFDEDAEKVRELLESL